MILLHLSKSSMESGSEDVFFEITNYLDSASFARLALTSGSIWKTLSSPRFKHWTDVTLQRVLYHVKAYQTDHLFVTGPAGSGKSYTLIKLYEENKRLRRVQIVSPTGVAAANFGNIAQTIHSFFGINIEWKKADDVNLRKISPTVLANLQELSLLLVDEISMVSGQTLDIMDRIAKYARNDSRWMGGLQVVFSGDFYQLPQVEGSYAFRSDLWRFLDPLIITLPVSVRHKNDLAYYFLLQRIRKGIITNKDMAALSSRLIKSDDDLKRHDGPAPLRLFTVNVTADACNKYEFNAIPQPVLKIAQATDRVVQKQSNKFGADSFLPSAHLSVQQAQTKAKALLHKYPDKIEFKLGARYIITYNINQAAGVVNGASCVLEAVQNDCVTVRLATDTLATIYPQVVRVKVKEEIRGGKKDEYYLERTQYTMRLGYALTIHSSQGMTLDSVIIDLDRSFAYHQAYVALSRVKTLKGLYLRHFDKNVIRVSGEVARFYGDLKEPKKKE